MHFDQEQHRLLGNHQLEVRRSHHLFQSLQNILVHLGSHRSIQEGCMFLLGRHQMAYSLQNILVHLDFLHRILLGVLQVVLALQIYQTYHFYLMPIPQHLLHGVHGRSLPLQYTLGHLGSFRNQLVPIHLPKLPHHKREKRYILLVHFHLYILEHLCFLHRMNLPYGVLRKIHVLHLQHIFQD